MDEKGFILEHPTRGILMDIEWDGERWRGKWSWSKLRPEAMWFPTVIKAKQELAKLPDKQQENVAILRYGNWEVA